MQTQTNFNILVIDDDKDICDNLSEYLSHKGFQVINCYSGQEGLNLVKQGRPHIVLMDIKLSDINGMELLKSIRALSPETLPIIISGFATIEAAAESITHGAYDFIAKPFNFHEVELTLRRAIDINVRRDKLARLKRRNLLMALTLPLWVLVGYIIIYIFKCAT